MAAYEVLYDGVKYRVDERELAQLWAGVDPADLDLVEITDSDPEAEEDERHQARFLRARP